ncbi:MAG: diaminopimelate epimerase [Acidobacteriota bacterium]|nr:MAG: diaminopimelate epimerase [Acidobacteriota bacterium]
MIFAAKYHGFGNDFVIVSSDQVLDDQLSGLARAICDPHFGIGADGCVYVGRESEEGIPIRIFNQDGSEAGMSGNGARCAAAFVHHRKLARSDSLTFQTSSGPKGYHLLEESFPVWRYRSAMGVAEFRPGRIPCTLARDLPAVEGTELELGERVVHLWAVNVGNPQCGIFCAALPDDEAFHAIGSALTSHPVFPEGTNISFIEVQDRNRVRIRIWERGVGPTHSSGTGCCGAALLSIRAGKVETPVEVVTETGSQVVEWDGSGEIALTGDAEFIGDIHFYWRDAS